MAITAKPDEATIIKNEMLSEFIDELYNNKVSNEYWEECSKSRTFFSDDDIDKMKQMINGKKEK
jgi:hypothetical protein